MAVSIDQMTYGRDATGRKQLIADITKDLNNAKSAFGQLTNINNLVKKYWAGADADKFVKELKAKADAAGKSCTKDVTTVTTALDNDNKNFDAMQNKNAELF